MKVQEILNEAKKLTAHFGGKEGSTTTDGKLAATKWAENITSRDFRQNKRERDLCVYLVGNQEGLERHIRDKERMGFTDLSKHKIIERHDLTRKGLLFRQEILARRDPDVAKIEIVTTYDDLVEYAKSLPPGSISHLDYDGVKYWGPTLEREITELFKLNIPNIHLVMETRNFDRTTLTRLKDKYKDDPSMFTMGGRRMGTVQQGDKAVSTRLNVGSALDTVRVIKHEIQTLGTEHGYNVNVYNTTSFSTRGTKTHDTYPGKDDKSRMMMFVFNKQ